MHAFKLLGPQYDVIICLSILHDIGPSGQLRTNTKPHQRQPKGLFTMALPDTSLSSQTDGSALPWILEHLLAYPASYEIPLRTTYTLNTAPRAQPLPYHPHQSSMPSLLNGSGFQSSPRSPQLSSEEPQQFITQAASEYFKSCLMEQISQLPSQPFSLPPSFITAFVRRCFPEDLCSVDFTQALTALDYLKDLENRRKRELAAALRRLDISKDTAGKTIDDVAQRYPRVAEWVSSMESKERNVEALYTQVYIGLRLWVCTCYKLVLLIYN